MNSSAALPHIHELVSGIAAYTYTSSRVNVSSAATTVQVVALYSNVLFRKQWHGSVAQGAKLPELGYAAKGRKDCQHNACEARSQDVGNFTKSSDV